MKFTTYLISLIILFSGCVPKIEKEHTINDTKIKNELIKDLTKFSSNDIELKNNWWENFGDKQLNLLITTALKDAPTLKQLEVKYQKATNVLKSKKAKNLPNIDFATNVSRQRFSENYIFPDPLGGNYYNLYETGVNLEYDFDFWDERKSLISASQNEALAQSTLIKVKQLAMATSLSKLYLAWNFQNKQIKQIEKLKILVEEKHHILDELYKLGLTNKKEVNQSNYLLEEVNQNIIIKKENIENIKNSIAIIAGLLPSQMKKLKEPNLDKNYKTSIPKDIHLDVVSHLPQIAIQKYLLKSRADYITNAKAKFYPNISLNGLIGFTSFPFSELLDKSSFAPLGAVAFSLPIFDAKKREANLNTKVNDYNAQVYEYNDTIIKAVNNIVVTLKKINLNKEQQKSEKTLIENKNKNREIEKKIYSLGLKNKTEYINTQIAVEEEKIKQIALKDKELQLHVELIKFLGGGYKQKVKDVLSSN